MLEVYTFDSNKDDWITIPHADATNNTPAPSVLRVLTWNVDFMAGREEERMKCALDYIQSSVFECANKEAPKPCVVLLQEVVADVIPVILTHDWVRAHFKVTPISNEDWPYPQYGNITLISRNVDVLSASRLVFKNSIMGRFALIVDVRLAHEHFAEVLGNELNSAGPRDATIRIANVHLESLPLGAEARPQQLRRVADELREPGICGGLVCGDMNAIGESDKKIPQDVGLNDAFDGNEDDENGYTWGYQPVCQFAPGRLDKVLYTSREGLNVQGPQRVGIGLKTARGTWVSDHYGLVTSVTISEE